MAGASRSPHLARAGELVAPFPRGDGARTSAVPRIDRKRTVVVTLSMLCYAAAIAVAAYPFLADRLGAWEAARSFTEQRDAFAAMPSEERETAAADAGAYNDMLAGHPHEDTASPYEEQLHLAADGSLCWIEIPRIGVKEPVYRSSNEEELEAALMTGAAHVRGTSLPVGGTSTNVVITGHTGLRESRMFDQLDLLEPGDAVVLWTMGEPLAYEVTRTELVTPDRTNVLCIDNGADQCTLITCRNPESSTGLLPTGAYTHRLVVHSDRTSWSPTSEGGSVEHLADARTALFAGSVLATGSLVWIVPAIALGLRREWVLDRVVGKREMGPRDVRSACARLGDARLRLGLFGRARLDLFGTRAQGHWSRMRPGRDRMSLDLRPRTARAPPAGPGPLGGAALPAETFEPRALDGELGIDLDGGASTLVFRPERTTDRNGPYARRQRSTK